MKTAWSIAAILFSSLLFAETPTDIKAIELLLAKEQYSNAITVLQQQADYNTRPDWQQLHAQALMGLQKNSDADDLLEQALKQFPQNADLLQASAMNKFALAQQVSIFSAPGYAKDGLAQLKQAVKLMPDNNAFKFNLIGFYLQAPGIAGGDEKAGRALAAQVQSADGIDTAIAQSMILSHDDKIAEAIQALDKALQSAPHNTLLLNQKASLLRSNKQDAAALPLYQLAAAHTDKPGARHQYLYQVGRIAAHNQLESALGKEALQQVIEFYKDGEGQTGHWARLRLAQIYLAEQNAQAAAQQLQPVLALKSPSERLEKERKALDKQLKKLTKKAS